MTDIPHGVLSETCQQVLAGRRLRAAAFLTFQFDPGFFEQEVLPVFFDVSLSHVPEIRLLGLAEELRKVDSIAVYYDRRALIAGAQSSLLDIQRVPVSQPTGYFHPKIVLALVEDALIVVALSSNLTRSGWWENIEVAHVEEVTREKSCSFRHDIAALIERVRRSAPHVARHEALDAISKFLDDVPQDEQRMRDGVVLPRLFYGDDDLVEFLTELAGNRLHRCNLEILSPFFDDQESALPIERLRMAFRPKAIRVFLPRKAEGTALCSAEYYERIRTLATWGTLPSEVMRLTKDLDRPLHAKVFRFFDRDRKYEAFFIGSANLTNAALARGGNVESGFFVEAVQKRRPDWWLIPNEKIPPAFASRSEADTLAEGTGWRLSLRYRWSDGIAACYWDSTMDSPSLTLFSHGVEVAKLDRVGPRTWMDLDPTASAAIAKALISGSFITVHIEGEPDAQILVEEEQLAHKPSLMARVTAADILRYWALLTADQKKEFLEEHADAFDDPEVALWLGDRRSLPDADSFFAPFAEVYFSFGNLQRAVRDALAAGRTKEAVDRLFGRKFDSLRRLIERVSEEQDPDHVRRYIVLLCARQALDILEREHPDLVAVHRRDMSELRQRLEEAGKIRDAFNFGDDEDRARFFGWFDRWFLRPARPVTAEVE